MALLIVVGLGAGNASAAPAIFGVTGTIADGQQIVISGSSFGATGPNIVLYDSFEKGTEGQNIATTTGSADIGNWSRLGNTTQTYSSDYVTSGAKSMRVNFSMWGSGPGLDYPDVQDSDFFLSWWQYLPSTASVPIEEDRYNWKWFWIGDGDDDWPWGSDYVTVCLSGDCSASIAVFPADDTGSPARDGGGWYEPLFDKGEWMRVSIAMRNATAGGYVWNQEIDGTAQTIPVNLTGVVTAHADDPWNVLTLPGFGHQAANATIYLDDVYVAVGAGARARVEIGNHASYGSATELTLATPTSWSATSITATVRTGMFGSSESAYLFVIDADGAVSPGYAITIGSGGGPDITPPVVSGGSPSGVLTSGTTQTTMSVTTNEAATCRNASSAGTAYADMTSTFGATGGTSHTTTVSGLGDGQSYTRYVRCVDSSGNANTSDYVVSWSVSDGACIPSCADKCSGADGCSGTCPDTCVTPETCGGGGTPNVCGCTPRTCESAGVISGKAADGCGGVLTCGQAAELIDTDATGGCTCRGISWLESWGASWLLLVSLVGRRRTRRTPSLRRTEF
jgi:hypothetical protein